MFSLGNVEKDTGSNDEFWFSAKIAACFLPEQKNRRSQNKNHFGYARCIYSFFSEVVVVVFDSSDVVVVSDDFSSELELEDSFSDDEDSFAGSGPFE